MGEHQSKEKPSHFAQLFLFPTGIKEIFEQPRSILM